MTSTSDRSSTCPDEVVEQVFRADWGRLLALLVSRTRRLDLAEDALSEAFARASARWVVDGVPANPAGWLYATAHRHVIGRLRAEAVAGRKAPLLAVRTSAMPADELADELTGELADDRLQLILLCCHPALPPESRSALALRFVIGTPSDQIARLFLVPPATMAARLTRAKKKIAVAGIPIGVPLADELTSRLDEVCRTIYLAFTAGYTPGTGPDLVRADLAGEAVQLARVLHDLVPDAPPVGPTLALVLLQHSRRDARHVDGRLVTLADQDRSLWHHDEIRTALAIVARLGPREGFAEQLRLQALIAAEHGRAPTSAATDWAAIARYYAELESMTGSAVVRLNRAVAVAEVDGPEAALALVDGLDDALRDNHRVAAVRAELARRAGDVDLARTSYLTAIGLCANDAEREHLSARLGTLR